MPPANSAFRFRRLPSPMACWRGPRSWATRGATSPPCSRSWPGPPERPPERQPERRARRPGRRGPARWPRAAAGPPPDPRGDGPAAAALLIEAQTDPAFGRESRARFLQPRRDLARAIFRRAIERGEIPADTNIEVALDLVFGPIYHRLMHGHAPLDDRSVRDLIDTALDGIAPVRSGQ